MQRRTQRFVQGIAQGTTLAALLGVAGLTGWLIGPTGVAAQATARVAFVDVQQVLARSVAGTAAREQLERDKAAMQKQLDGQRAEIERLRDELGQLSPRSTGAIFGHIAPILSAGKKPGEWQTLEVTLIGREVTVRLNSHIVIASEQIPGPTGAALDSDEGQPGPIMLQGDHGRVSFRNIVITPLLNEIP